MKKFTLFFLAVFLLNTHHIFSMRGEVSYLAQLWRKLCKDGGLLDNDLVGLGSKPERDKTKKILSDYIEGLKTGRLDRTVVDQTMLRIPKITTACQYQIVICNAFCKRYEEEKDEGGLVTLSKDISEIDRVLADIGLLEELKEAIPQGVFKLMSDTKSKTTAIADIIRSEKIRRQSTTTENDENNYSCEDQSS